MRNILPSDVAALGVAFISLRDNPDLSTPSGHARCYTAQKQQRQDRHQKKTNFQIFAFHE